MMRATVAASSSRVDVALVGGGPGGAAAANSILRAAPHLNVRIFERARELRRVGFTVNMMDNGMSAIQAISPECLQRVQGIILPYGRVGQYNAKGEELPAMKTPAEDLELVKVHTVPWFRLQQTLLDLLPEGTLQLGHALETLTLNPTGDATLHFHHQPPVTAAIVIGCDGNQSAARAAILGDSAPRFSGRAVWRGHTLLKTPWPFANDQSSWFVNSASRTGIRALMLDGYLVWTAYANWPSEELAVLGSGRYVEGEDGAAVQAAKLRRCLAALGDEADWAEGVLAALACADPSSITEHGVFYREPQDCTVWGRGPSSLLGDAAHLCTPYLGQGTNQAMEDAVELGRAIGEHGATEGALRQYEAVRQPRMQRVHEGSDKILKRFLAGQPADEFGFHKENLWLTGHVVEPLVAAK